MTILYAPNITQPIGGETYNKGIVYLEWDIKNPPTDSSSIALSDITYEIEYTEKYTGRETHWHTIRRRISGSDTSYEWRVGKMLKGDTIRFRVRSFCESLNKFSEYSQSPEDCSINVFKVMGPVILSPIENRKYSNFISIILDEAEVTNTYNQKVRYKLEYQSEDADVAWTTLFNSLPTGSSPLRWNIDSLPSAKDYQLKLTIFDDLNNQYTVSYVRNIEVIHPGLFYVDTKPPSGIVKFETNDIVTNKLDQIVNVYVDDETTAVKNMALRSKNLTAGETETALITLGPIKDPTLMFNPVQVEENCEFTVETGYIPKVGWTFGDESGIIKLDAKLTDYGGNTSCQDRAHLLMPLWSHTEKLTDMISFRETRDYLKIENNASTTESKYINLAYIGSEDGYVYRLEPYPVVAYKFSEKVSKLYKLSDYVYIFTYLHGTDVSKVYRDDRLTDATLLTTFTSKMCEVTAVSEYKLSMYFGMENGQLWKFDGSSFSLMRTFDQPVSCLFGDSRYLYIGLFGGTNAYIYDLYNFSSFNVEV